LAQTSPAIDTRPEPLPDTATTGVCARRAQVRAFGGLKLWPASSSKQIQAASAAAVPVPARVHTGRIDPDQIPLPDGGHVHLCGPLPFMHQVRRGLLHRGMPPERIAYEVFGPDMLRAGQA
jgi:ferredoxin-NADP reductase